MQVRLVVAVVILATLAACSSGTRPVASSASTAPSPTATAPGIRGFPAAMYPSPVPAATPNGVISQCPDHAGVESVPVPARSAAVTVAQEYNAVSLDADLHNADRSFWPDIEAMWAKPERGGSGTVVVPMGPFGTREWGFVVAACGHQLASQTLVVTLGPPRPFRVPGATVASRASATSSSSPEGASPCCTWCTDALSRALPGLSDAGLGTDDPTRA